MMSLGTFLLGAVVTFMIASASSSGFCDLGPPGTFCLKDLSGYRSCVVNKNTSRIEETVKKCPSGTRCTCLGIRCFTPFPCGPYKIPPVLPDSYHTEYNEEKTVCSPVGCQKSYGRVAVWRDARNAKYREVRTISNHNPHYEYIIILPYGRSLMKYHVIPSKQTCTKKIVRNLPPKIKVPTRFQFYNYLYVYGIRTRHWVWLEGGRNPSQPINVEAWDTAKTANGIPKVVRYSGLFPGSQASKTSVNIIRYYSVFKPGNSWSRYGLFQVPHWCHKSRAHYKH